MITKRELITIGFPSVKITEPIDWEQYIQLIKTSTNFHYPMFDSDLSNPYSLFGWFQKTIDLDLNNSDWDVITEEVGNNSWNESVGNLINYYIDNFIGKDNESPEIVRTWTEDGEVHTTGTSFDDLLKANAGNYFIEEWTPVEDIADAPEDENWTRWTIKTEQLRSPDFWVWHPMNIDEEHYQQVRGDDRSKLALQSGRNLQFTHSQDLYPKEDSAVGERNRRLEKYLRLIMPKYTRRVEIEDLNRDFWVIGEAISEISGFLFDDESPLAKMFKGIAFELTQIWENLIYLWSGYILSQSKECPIKVIYMPLPNNSAQTQRKYDYFEESLDNKESTWKKCEYLIDKYPNNSLVIIPYVRSGNYKHNYFDTYSIAYILTYNRLKNIRDTISVKGNDGGSFFWLQIRQTCQDGMNFQNWVYGVQKTENEQYKVIGNVFNAIEDTSSKYYAAARVDFKGVEAVYNDNGNIVLNNFQLDVVDPYKNNIIVNITGGRTQEGNTMTLTGAAGQGSEHSSGSYTTDNYSGYLGEMISTAVTTSEAPIEHEGPFQVVKIGDFYPVDVSFDEDLIEITEPEGSPDNPFCTDTYGIGAYYCQHTDPYTESTYVHFIRYDNGTTISSHELTKNDLKIIGKNYLEKLFKSGKVISGLCITKIGIGYWTGVSGSAWSHGLFSDLFYVDKKGEASKLTNVDLFDGYWCSKNTPEEGIPYFTIRPLPEDFGSRWRQPLFECTKVTYKEDGTYTLENGKFTWNDYNETVYPNDGPYNKNRPSATMDIKDGKLLFTNYQNNDGKQMLPKVSYDKVGQIIRTDQTRVDSDCFYVKSNDIEWGGGRDAGLFLF